MRLGPANHRLSVDRDPDMGLQPALVSLVARAIMQDGIDAARAEDALSRETLFNAHRPPRQPSRRGLDCPDAVIDCHLAPSSERNGAKFDGPTKRQQRYDSRSAREHQRGAQQQALTIAAQARESGYQVCTKSGRHIRENSRRIRIVRGFGQIAAHAQQAEQAEE